MHQGLKWDWETFPEYLNALENNKRDIDVCTLIPHAALRVFVMGDRAINHEKAHNDDMIKMRKISYDAIKAGAFGFSTSRTISHKSLNGEYTPTLKANENELRSEIMKSKKLKDSELLKDGFGIKNYINELSLQESRILFKHRCKVTQYVKMNFRNDKNYSKDLWKCNKCGNIDTESPLLWSSKYERIRKDQI